MVDMTIKGTKPPILVPGRREPGGVGRPNRYLANQMSEVSTGVT